MSDQSFSSESAAAEAARMLRSGTALKDIWRYAVIQLLDDYASVQRHEGVAKAAQLFAPAPVATGDTRVDAAFAALAEHLARRDGWAPPGWSRAFDRPATPWWFVTDMAGLHPRALVESPLSFRKRGVFITEDALDRV